MNTELKNAVLATDLKAQYDACAKKLLGYKDILARILIEAVEEFWGMSPEEVKPLIEDDIQIGKVPVDPWAYQCSCRSGRSWQRNHRNEYGK